MTPSTSKLRSLRLARKLSQAELGAQAGVDQREISKIESGVRKRPSFDTVMRLAKALNVHPEMIVERERER